MLCLAGEKRIENGLEGLGGLRGLGSLECLK
jgi:hypothetical protein